MNEAQLESIRYRLRTADTSALGCRDFAEHVRDDMEALIEEVEAHDLAEAELIEICHASIEELIEFFREEGPYLSEIRAKLAKLETLETLELSTKR